MTQLIATLTFGATILVVIIFAALLVPTKAAAQMCKWVDESGSVHYAETCPEGVEGERVDLQAPPTDAQKRAAQDAFRQRQMTKQARKDSKSEFTPESAVPNSIDAKICVDAKLAVDTLERPLPVYFDEARVLHHARSQHATTYQGERQYLNDAERKKELAHARQLISQHCGESKSDIIQQSDEMKSRIREKVCADYEAEAERMIRSRESGSADRARKLIEYCESERDH